MDPESAGGDRSVLGGQALARGDWAGATRLSRVYGGIHFLRAIADGRAAGRRIGAEVSRLLPPVHR